MPCAAGETREFKLLPSSPKRDPSGFVGNKGCLPFATGDTNGFDPIDLPCATGDTNGYGSIGLPCATEETNGFPG